MKKLLSKKFNTLLLFIFILLFPLKLSYAYNIPEPNTNYYIDNLNILSEETKNKINKQNNEFKNGEQIFILTVNNMDDDPQDYAVEAFNKYKLGNKKENNGLLILLARTSEGKHHIRIITGYGIEGILPDGKVGRIIDDNMMPYFIEGNLDKGISNGFDEICKVIKENIVSTSSQNNESNNNQYKASFDNENAENLDVLIVIVAFFISFIVLGILSLLEKIKKVRIAKMNYQDFIKGPYKYPQKYNYYYDRLKKLTKNKDFDTLNKDKEKSKNFKKIFEDICCERISKQISHKNIDELLEMEIKYDYEKKLYLDAVNSLTTEITDSKLEKYLNDSQSLYKQIFINEYIKRLKSKIKDEPIDELIKIKNNYDDSYLSKKTTQNLVLDILTMKAENMSDNELENPLWKSKDNDFYKIIEDEIEDRKSRKSQSYYYDDDDDDYYYCGPSSSSFNSSSFGGGFSGGGGSTGGGGAGRSF